MAFHFVFDNNLIFHPVHLMQVEIKKSNQCPMVFPFGPKFEKDISPALLDNIFLSSSLHEITSFRRTSRVFFTVSNAIAKAAGESSLLFAVYLMPLPQEHFLNLTWVKICLKAEKINLLSSLNEIISPKFPSNALKVPSILSRKITPL